MLPPPAPVVVVHADYGGEIDVYAKRVMTYKGRRIRVRLDGECDSACTMVAVLDDRLCVSPTSVMGFHQAYLPNPFDPLDTSMRAEDGTARLMRMYPRRLRD